MTDPYPDITKRYYIVYDRDLKLYEKLLLDQFCNKEGETICESYDLRKHENRRFIENNVINNTRKNNIIYISSKPRDDYINEMNPLNIINKIPDIKYPSFSLFINTLIHKKHLPKIQKTRSYKFILSHLILSSIFTAIMFIV